MNNPTQNRSWILGMCGRAATTAVALAIMLVPAVLATGSAQAQAFTTLADFQGSANGADPSFGDLIQGTDGNNYGTTVRGGVYDQGTVFKVTPDGTVTTLYTFCSQTNCTDGAKPLAGLVQVGENFYGTTESGGANGRGTVFEVTPGGQLTTLYSFCSQTGCTDGVRPSAGLVQAGGNFYGTAEDSGANGGGTVFEVTPAGQLTTLYSFCSQTGCTDGANPRAGLVQAGGNFYGTTSLGGANGEGTVFKITPGGTLTTLYSFCSQSGCTDGARPYAGLIQASNGNFYGTTAGGGVTDFCGGCGTLFEITPAGQLTTLYSFCSQSGCADGLAPFAGLIQASDGNLYGTTEDGGAGWVYGYGTAFGITLGGQLSTLHSFALTDGAFPDGGLLEDTNGDLYGTSSFGGSRFDGTVFSLLVGLGQLAETQPSSGKAGANIIHRPDLAGSTGLGPGGKAAANFIIHRPDLADAAGVRLSGNVAVVPGLPRTKLRIRELADAATGPRKVTAPAGKSKSFAQTLTTLLNFDGANGDSPYFTSLIQGTDGNLYGTTREGGVYDQGTVFKVAAGGTLTTLYSFCFQINCTDGAEPEAGLVQATNGNLYGTTYWGGANGSGTIFEITPAGQLTTLYSFCSQMNCADGRYPQAGLVQATNGNLYGTTLGGGITDNCSFCGTIFEITPAGQLTTVYSFCSQNGCADGAVPYAGLIQASDGNLYGTTRYGGSNNNCVGDCGSGTVFEIAPAGQLTTLYSFCSQNGCTDGIEPEAGLVQATNGSLYGTTTSGGTSFDGTVFAITLAGQLSTLYSFCSQPNCSDGTSPYAGLVQATDGNLYGTTESGGANDFGTVFEITPAGQLTTLYAFGFTDGALPSGGLLQSNGNLYGMTEIGGSRDGGTIFSLPLAQQVITLSSPTGTAQVGVAYSSALTVTGGVAPYTFSISIGALPPGLSLNSSTGAITGTPTTAGTYNLTAQVVDSQGNTATASCSIVVSPAVLTLSGPTGTAQLGVAYSSVLNAAGGVPPYTFSIISGSLPPGLLLNSSTGAITGTPTTVGTYNFTAQVVDSQGNTATASCSIVVTSAGTNPTTTSLTLVPSNIPVGSVGPIVMTATVTPVSGGGTPAGSVTFFNGSTQVGTTTLSGGVGTFNYNPSSLAVGIYSITAVYSGDSMFAASTSAPQTLAITPIGPFAYVANNSSNTVSVINIPTGQVVNSILVGSGPLGTAISPDQTQVYVTNNQGNSVFVINAASSSVVATIPVQSSPMGVAFTPDGTAAYVVNSASNSVSVINTASQTVTATVPVQSTPVGVAMAFTSNGTFAYVTNEASDTVSVIAVASNTVVQTISVGAAPRWVAVSPNSSLAYVSNSGDGTISVISVATNTVTNSITVGMSPFGVAFTPDNNFAYVANSGSNTVSLIDTANGAVVATVVGFNNPVQVAITADGTSAYVTNQNTNNVSVIATASNTITATVGVGSDPIGVAIATAPPTELQITMPLSPTQPNVFNFGTNNQAVQYPPGTQFSGVNMTTTAVQITQAQFQQRVAGTQFANAACIVYSGAGGNCLDYQVTCSDNNGNPIACPSESQPTIAVQTSFSTGQAITNPGYLTTPIGQNLWQNIFTGYADPTVKGQTSGFSEFVAVNLGATNPQGLAQFEIIHPRLSKERDIVFGHENIPVAIRLTSIANGSAVTDAEVSISVVMIADAQGNPTQQTVLTAIDAFEQTGPRGDYRYDLDTADYALGTYTLTIYGNAFPAYQGQFKIKLRSQ